LATERDQSILMRPSIIPFLLTDGRGGGFLREPSTWDDSDLAEDAFNCERAARGLKGVILRANVTTDRSTSAFPLRDPAIPLSPYETWRHQPQTRIWQTRGNKPLRSFICIYRAAPNLSVNFFRLHSRIAGLILLKCLLRKLLVYVNTPCRLYTRDNVATSKINRLFIHEFKTNKVTLYIYFFVITLIWTNIDYYYKLCLINCKI